MSSLLIFLIIPSLLAVYLAIASVRALICLWVELKPFFQFSKATFKSLKNAGASLMSLSYTYVLSKRSNVTVCTDPKPTPMQVVSAPQLLTVSPKLDFLSIGYETTKRLFARSIRIKGQKTGGRFVDSFKTNS